MFTLPQRVELRKSLRQKREALSPEFRKHASREIVDLLIELPIFQASRRVALYLPYNSEVDISPLVALAPQKEYYLPILTTANHLEFSLYHLDDPLQPNIFGIPEPINQQLQNPDQLDLVCMPLVGFDEQGNRLGMGGGYYDRTFAFKQNETFQPFLLGIAFACQKIDQELETEVWDIPLDGILTEQKFYSLQQ
jgi:5-formyltetrahydrofolate cyclo-ligase